MKLIQYELKTIPVPFPFWLSGPSRDEQYFCRCHFAAERHTHSWWYSHQSVPRVPARPSVLHRLTADCLYKYGGAGGNENPQIRPVSLRVRKCGRLILGTRLPPYWEKQEKNSLKIRCSTGNCTTAITTRKCRIKTGFTMSITAWF